MSNWSKLPTALNDGSMVPFMSHRDREHLAFALFHGAGDYERMLHLLEKDDEKFFDWGKELLLKRLPRPVAVEHGASAGVEAMLAKLDERDRMRTINGEAEVVE